MSEQHAPYNATATPSVYQPIDTNTLSGVKCIRVTGTQTWRERIGDLLDGMRASGHRPRMAVIFWDGEAFQFRETNPPHRISVE